MVHCKPLSENKNVPATSLSESVPSGFAHFMALVAIECEHPGSPPKTVLDRDTSSALADALAHDLAAHVPEIRSLDFVMVGAVYDQAQLLRPGWSLHAALGEALDRLPTASAQGHVVALGAHAGKLPLPALEPEAELLGSPMLVMPWLLSGPVDIINSVASRLERELLDTGLISAELALAIGEAFGVKCAHARHMTVLDLCALTCAQYEHAGMAGLWQIIETALLRMNEPLGVNLDGGGSLHYGDGTVHGQNLVGQGLALHRAILAAHGLNLETEPAH